MLEDTLQNKDLSQFSTQGNGNPLQYSCLGNPWGERERILAGYSPQQSQRVDTAEKVRYILVLNISKKVKFNAFLALKHWKETI